MQSPTGGMGGGGYEGGGMGANGGPPAEEQPWYVKYGLRALGTAAGGLAVFFGLFSLLFSVFSPTCIVMSVLQIMCGVVVITVESPCCMFCVEHIQFIVKVSEMVERKPLWMKAAAYVIVPLFPILFCFGANTFLGCGSIIGVGVLYGMIALGKKATREEMARNAQTIFPKNSYQPHVNTPQPPPPMSKPVSPITSPPGQHTSGLTGPTDPIQASAAQWAAQTATATFEPPPTYNQSQQSGHRPVGWDQTFVNDNNQAGSQRNNDPFANPFQ